MQELNNQWKRSISRSKIKPFNRDDINIFVYIIIIKNIAGNPNNKRFNKKNIRKSVEYHINKKNRMY